MSLRLNVGVSKKVGLPSFSSVGASCHIELDLELEPGVLETDLDGFHRRVRSAYVAAHQAVNDQLARLQAGPEPSPPARARIENGQPEGDGHPNRPGPRVKPPAGADGRHGRAATPNQVKAIRTIARKQGADLEGLLCDHDVARVEDLTLPQASRLIDQLRAVAPG